MKAWFARWLWGVAPWYGTAVLSACDRSLYVRCAWRLSPVTARDVGYDMSIPHSAERKQPTTRAAGLCGGADEGEEGSARVRTREGPR